MTLDNAIENRRDGVECRYRDRVASGLQPTGQGAGHATLATSSRDGKGDLLVVEPFDQSRRNLDRTTASPCLTCQTDNDCPGSNEVVNSPVDFQGVETTFCCSVEVVSLPQALSQRCGLAPGELDRLLVCQRQSQRFVTRLMRYHGNRNGAPETLVKVAQEAVTNTQQLVRGGAGDSDLYSALEAAPEGPKIFIHDSQSPESEAQGYSPAPAL